LWLDWLVPEQGVTQAEAGTVPAVGGRAQPSSRARFSTLGKIVRPCEEQNKPDTIDKKSRTAFVSKSKAKQFPS